MVEKGQIVLYMEQDFSYRKQALISKILLIFRFPDFNRYKFLKLFKNDIDQTQNDRKIMSERSTEVSKA